MNPVIPFRFESWGLRIWRGEPQPMRRLHSHTEIELNLVLRGGVTYRFAGEALTMRPGSLYVFSGLTPHVLETVEPGTDFYFVTVPLAAFIRWRLPENITAPVLRGEILVDQGDADHDPRRFARWQEDLEGGDARRVRVMLPEVQARLERMALSAGLGAAWRRGADGARRTPDSGTLARVEIMLHMIAEHFAEPLTLKELAAKSGWHAHYAAGQFRKWIGLPPGEFLLRQRVAHACHLLASTEAKVLTISEECGFATQSSFYAAFTRIVKCAPGKFRCRLRERARIRP